MIGIVEGELFDAHTLVAGGVEIGGLRVTVVERAVRNLVDIFLPCCWFVSVLFYVSECTLFLVDYFFSRFSLFSGFPYLSGPILTGFPYLYFSFLL